MGYSKFVNGMLRDYEELINSIPENGIRGNEKISDLQLASYVTGMLCGKIVKRRAVIEKLPKPGGRYGFGELDVIAFQAAPKSPYIFSRTFEKMAVNGHYLGEKDKELFANLCANIATLKTDEMEGPSFLAGFMHYC